MQHRRLVARIALLLVGTGALTTATACGAPDQDPPSWDAVAATSTGLWDTVPVTLTWSLDGDGGSEGFTVELPPELRALVPATDATTADGTRVGHVEVDGDVAHVTWDGAQEGRATAELPTAWDPGAVGAGEDVELTFRAGVQEVAQRVSIRADEADLSGGRLYGYWTDRENEDRLDSQGALQWRYVTPLGTPTPVRLVVDSGQEIDCGAITFRVLDGGDEGREIPGADAPEYTCTGRALEVTLEPRAPGEALMLLVAATPVDTEDSYTADVEGTPEPLTSTVDRAGGTADTVAAGATAPGARAVAARTAGALAAAAVLAVIVIAAARRRRPGRRT
ncbi:hypothetical protein UQW22_07370 [Isoptericola halotolerans]|uniref:hypothetical protein n=1 Tax=Isoptericola halotolerans TaxID=300560 RepID=UPI00388DB326